MVSAMYLPKLYAITAAAGIAGVIGGGLAASSVYGAFCPSNLECFGLGFLSSGIGFIVVESCAMSLAAHIANRLRGNLLLTWLPTVLLAVPITLVLPAFIFVFALPLFLVQTWICVKVQLATQGERRARSQA